ncbi:hypothetical protein OH492_14310 [Vibrio chagasii]|nr:hypothetical protein [Vibrio chagasii]
MAFNDKQTAESYQKARESNHYENGIPDDTKQCLFRGNRASKPSCLQASALTPVLRGKTKTQVKLSTQFSDAEAIPARHNSVLPDVGFPGICFINKTINNKTELDNNG